MSLKTQKPEIKTNVDEFLKGAQAEIPVRQELTAKKEKTFLLKLPYSLWKQAKYNAAINDATLHDYIVKAILEKNTSLSK